MYVILCTDLCVSLKMMKNLFMLNSSGTVKPKKHVTMQNTLFRLEMTAIKKTVTSAAFSSVCRNERYKSCSKPHNAQVGQGTIIFILQMKKQKLRKPGMHVQLLRANSKWIFIFLLK